MDLDGIAQSQWGIREKGGRGPTLEEQRLMKVSLPRKERGLEVVVDKGSVMP